MFQSHSVEGSERQTPEEYHVLKVAWRPEDLVSESSIYERAEHHFGESHQAPPSLGRQRGYEAPSRRQRSLSQHYIKICTIGNSHLDLMILYRVAISPTGCPLPDYENPKHFLLGPQTASKGNDSFIAKNVTSNGVRKGRQYIYSNAMLHRDIIFGNA